MRQKVGKQMDEGSKQTTRGDGEEVKKGIGGKRGRSTGRNGRRRRRERERR